MEKKKTPDKTVPIAYLILLTKTLYLFIEGVFYNYIGESRDHTPQRECVSER